MTPFGRALDGVERRVPELRLAIVLGIDGIPVEKRARGDELHLETMAAEFTTLLRSSVSAGSDTGLGDLAELTIVTHTVITALVSITPDYFLFGAFAPETEVGRARYALRVAALELRREFD